MSHADSAGRNSILMSHKSSYSLLCSMIMQYHSYSKSHVAHHKNPPQSPHQGKVVERARPSSPSVTKSSSVLRCLRRCILDNRLRRVLRLPDSLRALGLGASPNTAPVYSTVKGKMTPLGMMQQKLTAGKSFSTARASNVREGGRGRGICVAHMLCPSTTSEEAVSCCLKVTLIPKPKKQAPDAE